MNLKQHLFKLSLMIVIIIAVSCSDSPKKIEYGLDACDECNMSIMNAQYGSELITEKGKVYKFDSVECLANFYIHNKTLNIKSMWVANFSNQNEFIKVEKGIFIKNDKIHSPMGLNVLAVKTEKEKNEIINSYGGKVVTWDDILTMVKENE